ncbi:MAG: sigma-70 family RNA polymerase sigma factor [Phycisphaera sp.]|nr:sigma-70 family RNA polymerase sigma factor [Phycisphaera sp.]
MSDQPLQHDDANDAGRRNLLALLMKHQRRLFGFTYTLVPNRDDAEDVLQDATRVMWEKFDGFEPGSDFFAWACRVIRYEVMHHRRSHARSRLVFDSDVLESVATDAAAMRDGLDERRAALESCLDKLPEDERRFLMRRYEHDGSVAAAAQLAARSTHAAYKALSRLRRALLDCVRKQMPGEEVYG